MGTTMSFFNYVNESFKKRSLDSVAKDTILSVAISPDNQTVLGGGWKIIRLWRLNTGELFQTLEGHSDWVLSIAASPDGNRLVSASADSTIKVWDLKTRKAIQTLKSHSNCVNVVVVSPDGKTLVSGSVDTTIKIWELSTGKLLHTLAKHSGEVCSLAISSDGKIIVSGSTDKKINLWELSSGNLLRTLEGHSDWVQAVAITPDRQTLVSGCRDGSIKIWQGNSHKEEKKSISNSDNISFTKAFIIIISLILAKFTSGISLAAIPLLFNKTLRSVISESISEFPIETLECVNTISEDLSSVNSLAISPDGQILVIGCDDGTIKIWKPDTHKSLKAHSGFVISVAISANSYHLITTSQSEMMFWNLKNTEFKPFLTGSSAQNFNRTDTIVAPPKLTSLFISPTQSQLKSGETKTFNIKGLDQLGNEIKIENVSWQATGGTINKNGFFRAGENAGNFTVTATVGTIKTSASLTIVAPPKLTSLLICTTQLQLKSGETKTFNIKGLDQRGNEIKIENVSWQATGGTIDRNGFFQAGENAGDFTVTATVETIKTSASITIVAPPKVTSLAINSSQEEMNTVTNTVKKISVFDDLIVEKTVTLTSLVISPKRVQLNPNQLQKFTIKGLDQYGCEIAIERITWKATGGKIDQYGNFIVDNDACGKFTITATLPKKNLSVSADVIVLPVLKELCIFPEKVALEPDESFTFVVIGIDQQGNFIDIPQVNWQCSQGGKINGNGTFTGGYEKREVTVTASLYGISNAAKVKLLPVLRRIEIKPQQGVILKPDESQTFRVIGFDQYGSQIKNGSIYWEATGGKIDQKGTFIAGHNAKGKFKVKATATEMLESGIRVKLLTLGMYMKLTSQFLSLLSSLQHNLLLKSASSLVKSDFSTSDSEEDTGEDLTTTETPSSSFDIEAWLENNSLKIISRILNLASQLCLNAAQISASVEGTIIPVLRRIEINPKKAELEPNKSLTFTVIGFDQQGDWIETGIIKWTATGGKISTNGTFVAHSNAKSNVRVTAIATEKNFIAYADITILPDLERIDISPERIPVTFYKQIQLKPDKDTNVTVKSFDQQPVPTPTQPVADSQSQQPNPTSTQPVADNQSQQPNPTSTQPVANSQSQQPNPTPTQPVADSQNSYYDANSWIEEKQERKPRCPHCGKDSHQSYPNRYVLTVQVALKARKIYARDELYRRSEKSALRKAAENKSEELLHLDIVAYPDSQSSINKHQFPK